MTMRNKMSEPYESVPRAVRTLLSVILAAVIAVVTVTASGCSSDDAPYNPDTDLRILAGSEVEDMTPILEDAEEELGINIRLTSTGTIDGTESVMSGDASDYDATWFPSNAYMSLFENKSDMVSEEHSIMSSPIVLGVNRTKASELGWDASAPTWDEIVQAVEDGRFTFGMTSPVSSNSGFSTVVEMTTALSGTGAAITTADVDTVKGSLSRFASGQGLTSGSSGWLMEAYDADTSKVDGVFNYESVIKSDPNDLVVVIPQDGVITADYPLTLLGNASDKAAENYGRLVEYLERDDVQKRIEELTNRRTSSTTDAIEAFEVPFPNRIETVRYLLQQWVSEVRKPANIFFQLDMSGSMSGDRLESLKSALRSLTESGADSSSTSDSLLTFQPRESIEMTTFSDAIIDTQGFDVSDDGSVAGLSEFIDSLSTYGGTAIYSSLQDVLYDAAESKSDGTFTSVVLLTDGENNDSTSYRDFESWYSENEDRVGGIPVYSIAFGEGNRDELKDLAQLTGGKVFDADGNDLTSAFKEIRGYL